MHAWLNNYKVFLTHAKDTRRIYPVQDDAPIQYVATDEEIFFRLRIKNDLKFQGEDYQWLLAIENGPERCLPITVEVKRIRPGFSDLLVYSGTAFLNNATIDRSFCEIILKVEAEDNYTALYKIWERTKNVLLGATKVCIYTNFKDTPVFISEITKIDTVESANVGPGGSGFLNPDFPDPDEGWKMYTDEVKITNAALFFAERRTRWYRETTSAYPNYITPPPGGASPGGWQSYGDQVIGNNNFTYYRDVDSILQTGREVVNTVLLGEDFGPFGQFPFDEYKRYYSWIPLDHPQLCNGLDISEVLNSLLEGTGVTYRSNFFNINPDGSAPSNDAYNRHVYDRVIVFQRTDILSAGASTPATIFNVTLKGFLEQLREQYDIRFVMRGTELLIEHRSYHEGKLGIDMTLLTPSPLPGKYVYTYDADSLPSREEWYQDGEYASQTRFKRFTIDYLDDDLPNCITIPGGTRTHTAGSSCNDVQSMVANPQDFATSGMVFVPTWEFEGQTMIGADRGLLNYQQTPSFLCSLLWRNRRPFPQGLIISPTNTGTVFIALSVQPIKKQVPISIHLRLLENFDPLKLQKTQMGWGEVIEAEYSLKSGVLTFTPLHL